MNYYIRGNSLSFKRLLDEVWDFLTSWETSTTQLSRASSCPRQTDGQMRQTTSQIQPAWQSDTARGVEADIHSVRETFWHLVDVDMTASPSLKSRVTMASQWLSWNSVWSRPYCYLHFLFLIKVQCSLSVTDLWLTTLQFITPTWRKSYVDEMEVHWFNMTDCLENMPKGKEE